MASYICNISYRRYIEYCLLCSHFNPYSCCESYFLLFIIISHCKWSSSSIIFYFDTLGGVLCLFSSMPGLDKSLGHEVQYWFALIGQCFYGVTYTIIQNLTTEIAETWFDAGQRVLATSLLTIAFSFGLILGQGLTPQFIFCPEDVYLLNIVWAIPTILFSVLCLFTV